VVSQWVWNLRLELGHQLEPTPMRTTEFAPARPAATEQPSRTCGYGKPSVATTFKVGRFSGHDFCPSTRWHPALSRWAIPARARATQRGRWKPARRVCSQHSQLPPLPFARAVPMARERHQEAAPGQRAVASIGRWFGPAALVGLESQTLSPSLPAVAPPPAG
jgi:hypothetical protein